MNLAFVREAATRAARLSQRVVDHELKVAAFGVLFARLLDSESNDVGASKRLTPAAAPRGSASRGQGGPIGRVRELIADGLFKQPKRLKAIVAELSARGRTYDSAIVGKNLQRLVQDRVLRRTLGKEGNREVYFYAEW